MSRSDLAGTREGPCRSRSVVLKRDPTEAHRDPNLRHQDCEIIAIPNIFRYSTSTNACGVRLAQKSCMQGSGRDGIFAKGGVSGIQDLSPGQCWLDVPVRDLLLTEYDYRPRRNMPVAEIIFAAGGKISLNPPVRVAAIYYKMPVQSQVERVISRPSWFGLFTRSIIKSVKTRIFAGW